VRVVGYIRESLLLYFRRNAPLYAFVAFLMVTGIAFGAVAVRFLPPDDRGEMIDQVQSVFAELDEGEGVDQSAVFYRSLLRNARTAAILWLMGVTVVGLPAAIGVLFLRGFATGFAAGFFVHELGYKGVALALLAILPPNLIAVPVLVALGACSIGFSWRVARGGRSGLARLYGGVVSYTAACALLAVLLASSSLVDAYVVPPFVRAVAAWVM